MKLFGAFCIALCAWLGFSAMAHAIEIQTITSPGGIKAWLVESHSVPIISMNFSFEGGASQDPAGKEGAADLMAAMMSEGAGEFTAGQFKSEANRLAMELNFNASADHIEGNLASLSKNRDASFALLKLNMSRPRFDGEAFARVQQLSLQGRKREALDQDSIAGNTWAARAFPNHVYGRPVAGTSQSVATVSVDDLRKLHLSLFNRRTLKIAVVGDIDAATLSQKLDEVFGELPDAVPPAMANDVTVARGPFLEVIDYDGPQTSIYFGNPGIPGRTRESWAAFLMSEILGGRATFARLNQSMREKSGLTYGVSMFDANAPHASYQMGSMSTSNETAMQALDLLRVELAKMAKDGPTEEELRKVKAYINGSYPLRFTSNMSISSALLTAQERGREPDYIEVRPDKVNAVTLADVKAVAAKLLKPENHIIVMVGKPKL